MHPNRHTRDPAVEARIEGYRRELETVKGWFSLEDFDAFLAIDLAQRELGIRGPLLEIGCFEGRSTILLGMLARADEDLVVCDLFHITADGADPVSHEGYRGFRRETFEKNYLRFHDNLPSIEAGLSSFLPASYPGPRFRILHVDGSHEYETVCGDLAYTASAAVVGGVVVIDDYRTAHTPGVAAALWEVSAADTLRPALLTQHKAYAAVDEHGEAVCRRALEELERRGYRFEVRQIHHRPVGHPALQVPQEPSGMLRGLARGVRDLMRGEPRDGGGRA